jgi:hypothetical protein
MKRKEHGYITNRLLYQLSYVGLTNRINYLGCGCTTSFQQSSQPTLSLYQRYVPSHSNREFRRFAQCHRDNDFVGRSQTGQELIATSNKGAG